MTKYFGALTLVLMLGIVLTRVFLLKQQGIQAMKFGDIDKTDFFIPPFALLLLLWSVVSFRQSFRVGIDADHPDRLITDGVFAFSRNPIYVAFAIILIGEFFILPNWITLIYIAAVTWLFHRQVLREEDYLRRHYGHAYVDYCNRVRRYL
jgi:protein-S-isoprenylcysteine O-methyltransferase Ste14